MQRLEVSGAVRHMYMSLGGKGLSKLLDKLTIIQISKNVPTFYKIRTSTVIS
jgi:hypothetical protein